jgi:hypothetical protein
MIKFLALFGVLVAVAVGYVYQNNPLLFGKRTGESHDGFTVYTHFPELDDELFGLAGAIGRDFAPYRNHCLRVLTFTRFFLPDDVLTALPNAMQLAATAMAYHDVGLWTDHDLNYLEPSRKQLDTAVARDFSDADLATMDQIVLQHHKYTDFAGLGPERDALVNAVRKADWADATMGLVRFGLPPALLEAAYDQVKEAGFHAMLLGMDARLSPGNKLNGTMEVLKILKW